MLPAIATEDIAKVRSEAQRTEVMRFILVLLVSSVYVDGALEGIATSDVKSSSSAPFINSFVRLYFKACATEDS